MKNKICLVTGANAGIGYSTALGLARKGATVLILCRNPEKGAERRDKIKQLAANNDVHLFIADLSNQQAIRRVAQQIHQQYERLDVLINNAGGIFSELSYSVNGIEMQFATNHLSYFLLTHLLLPLFINSHEGRIINVASRSHRQGDIHFDDLYFTQNYHIVKAYAQSKLANVLFTYELHRRLQTQGLTHISANVLHPGLVRTHIGNKSSSWLHRLVWSVRSNLSGISREKGARTSIYLASSDEVQDISGQYFSRCKIKRSSRKSHDLDLAQRLWMVSEELTHISDYFGA